MTSKHQTVIVLDLETTGLDHRTERIIEIGAVKMDQGEIVDTFQTLVNPEAPIRHSSYQIHHISEEMVADAPVIADVMPKLLEFMGDLPFVAHNALFDYSFLNEAHKRLYEGKRLANLRIDTFEMFRQVFPEDPSHGLSALLARFGFDSHVEHRAMDDARCLALVYPKLVELYEQQLQWQFSQLPNVPYLVERYQRLHKTVQMLQSEMNDLREVFRLHFAEGGKSVPTTSGELMVSSYRRSYEYNDAALRDILDGAGLQRKAYKVNAKVVDRLVDNPEIDEDVRGAIKDARVRMTETRLISFIKPSEPKEPVASADDAPQEAAQGAPTVPTEEAVS